LRRNRGLTPLGSPRFLDDPLDIRQRLCETERVDGFFLEGVRMGLKDSARLAALVVMLGLIGCSNQPPTGTVTGFVRYGGQPLTQGLVTFVGPNGQSGSARIQADGKYTVTNAPLGENKIAISMPPPEGSADLSKDAPNPGDAQEFQLPAHYADPSRSELKYAVKTGPQTHHIDLH
jgi:hypothetical protein